MSRKSFSSKRSAQVDSLRDAPGTRCVRPKGLVVLRQTASIEYFKANNRAVSELCKARRNGSQICRRRGSKLGERAASGQPRQRLRDAFIGGNCPGGSRGFSPGCPSQARAGPTTLGPRMATITWLTGMHQLRVKAPVAPPRANQGPSGRTTRDGSFASSMSSTRTQLP
jgi:hypothetical protein